MVFSYLSLLIFELLGIKIYILSKTQIIIFALLFTLSRQSRQFMCGQKQ